MSRESLVAEAEQASIAFQQALLRLGATTIVEALALWRKVSPTDVAGTAEAWLDDAVKMISTRRGQSRELAIGYYRLVRALRTGTTVPDPRRPEPAYVTLEDLREEFAALVDDVKVEAPEDLDLGEDEVDVEDSGADERIAIDADDELARLIREGREEDERAEAEARSRLEALGPTLLKSRVKLLDAEALTGKELDDERAAQHARSGARVASVAESAVLNGARGELYRRATRDRKALGFIRLSRSGTPCGWCAMLISRGPVYLSEASAEHKANGDQYHDNCHCYAEPLFSNEQYGSSPLYELNRRYSKEWPKVTRELSGKAAVAAWRRHIRRQARAAATPTAA